MSHIQPISGRRRPRHEREPVFPPAEITHRRKILADPHAEEADRLQQEGRRQRARMLCGVIMSRELAAQRAEREVQARDQARRACAPEVWASAADRGTQGQAMQARGAKVEDVLVDVEEQAGATYLERASVARVRDGTIDHYERIGVLWGRRLDAVTKLASLYQSSRIAPGIARSSGGVSRGHGNTNSHQARAWSDYCRACDHLSPGVRTVVEDVARGLFPAALDAVLKLRAGSWELANHFLLFPDKHP